MKISNSYDFLSLLPAEMDGFSYQMISMVVKSLCSISQMILETLVLVQGPQNHN